MSYGDRLHQRLSQSGYERLPERVFLLDEHRHERDDGAGYIDFDRPFLERIAAKLNFRAHVTGSPPLFCLGHTRPGRPEAEQPRATGAASDFSVDFYYKDPKTGRDVYAISAQPWAMPGEKETFKRYPRRSIELWVGKDGECDIDPIALLGPTTPRRDIGVHLFQRPQDDRYFLTRELES